MHKTGGFLHIQRILKRDIKRARRDKECAPQQLARENERQRFEIEQLKQRINELERKLTEKAD